MMCDKPAPIVLFVYNRPDHTRRVLDSLSDALDSDKSELFIYADGAKNPSAMERVNTVRQIISNPEYHAKFKKVSIILREKNCGLERNIIDGVTEIIERYGSIIVLEDDIVVSKDFIQFMNRALISFENDPLIWSISTNTPYSRRIARSKDSLLWSNRASCWGWATWADRWNKVDWNVKDYSEFANDRKKQKDFNKGGRDMSWMLKLQQKGYIQSWAIRWCYSQYKNGMITLFPKYAKSINIGLDGSGTNSGKSNSKEFKKLLKENSIKELNYSTDNTVLKKKIDSYFMYAYWRQRMGALWYVLTDYDNIYVRR